MAGNARRKKLKLTPFGYMVLAALILLVLVAVVMISRYGGKASVAKEGEISGSGDPLGVSMDATQEENALDNFISGASADEQLQRPEQNAMVIVTTKAPTPTISLETTPCPVAGQPTPSPTPALYSRTPSPEEEAGAVIGKLNTGGVNLRAGASKYDKILGTGFTKGTKVKVFAVQNSFYFVQIVATGDYGFIACDFINVDGITPEPQMTSVPQGAVGGSVCATKAMLRNGPAKDYNGLGEYRRNTLLYIYYVTDGWYYVEVAKTGEKGYMRTDLVAAENVVPER